MRDPDVVTPEQVPMPELDDESQIEAEPTFALPQREPDGSRDERLYGTFDGLPPQASTAHNLANRRRVIE